MCTIHIVYTFWLKIGKINNIFFYIYFLDDSNFANAGAELFFFPGESNLNLNNGKPLPQVTTELGDVTYRSNKSSDTDDEFCFVDRDTGLGILVK